MKFAKVLCLSVFAASAMLAAQQEEEKPLPLPQELSDVPEEEVLQFAVLKSNPSAVEDPLAAGKFACKKTFSAKNPLGTAVNIAYHMPSCELQWGKTTPIPISQIKTDKYTLFRCGTNRLFRDVTIVMNNDWGGPLDIRNSAANVSEPGENYTLYISLRGDGPSFNPDSKLKRDILYWDRIFFVLD